MRKSKSEKILGFTTSCRMRLDQCNDFFTISRSSRPWVFFKRIVLKTSEGSRKTLVPDLLF